MARRLTATVAILGCCAAVSGAEPDPAVWRLAFEDAFERAEPGENWDVPNGAIVDGRLRFGDDNTRLAIIRRPFAPDVRVEFDAEAVPERAPCDLSAGLACGTLGERRYGYILAFGGMGNTGHQIVGGGRMARAVVMYPDNLIEPGRVYRIAAVKEGQALTLEVDGKVILEATDEDPLAGAYYDRVGLVTWNGMLADNVRVYERTAPHPDTPACRVGLPALAFSVSRDENGAPSLAAATPSIAEDPAVSAGIDRFNAGRPAEAVAFFLDAENPAARVLGAAWAIGHPDFEETFAECREIGSMLVDYADAREGDDDAAAIGELGRCVRDLSLLRANGMPNGETAATRILAFGEENNPFQDKALFYKARFLRAHAQEGGRSGKPAQEIFARLRRSYPANPNLRELTGDRIPWGEEWIDDDSEAPAWARYLRELYGRQCEVLRWWFTERQLPSGELGGGWGDDVEILRGWGPVARISTGAPDIVAGIERMGEGIWRDELDPIGFAGFGDVEHAAEPSSDTLPTLMILGWGDPLWIERNMRSARQLRDVYMGIDANGYYRFRSAFFGGEEVGQSPAEGGDNGYCARPMSHLRQLAYWGNTEALRVYLSWVDGWYRQTMAEYPDKPAGVAPNSIYYPDGGIIPPGHDVHYAEGAHFLLQSPGMAHRIQGAFMSAHLFTGDRRYLEPIRRYAIWNSYGPLRRGPQEPGTMDWVIAGAQYGGDVSTLATYRWITGDPTVDEYILRFARPAQRYLVTHDLDRFIGAVEKAARRMRTGFRLMTTETLQTDRAGLPGMLESYGAYTGAVSPWFDAYHPTHAVTWDAPDLDFAALVIDAGAERIRVWIYSFHDDPVEFGARFWRLRPGRYEVRIGEILPGEQENHRYGWSDPETFSYRRRTDGCRIVVPARSPQAIDVRLVEPIEVSATAPDPALGRDTRRDGDDAVTVTVHNLGSEPVDAVEVVAIEIGPDGDRELGRKKTGVLQAPKLRPVTQTLRFEGVASDHPIVIRLDPEDLIDELCETNNAAFIPGG